MAAVDKQLNAMDSVAPDAAPPPDAASQLATLQREALSLLTRCCPRRALHSQGVMYARKECWFSMGHDAARRSLCPRITHQRQAAAAMAFRNGLQGEALSPLTKRRPMAFNRPSSWQSMACGACVQGGGDPRERGEALCGARRGGPGGQHVRRAQLAGRLVVGAACAYPLSRPAMSSRARASGLARTPESQCCWELCLALERSVRGRGFETLPSGSRGCQLHIVT